MNRQEKKWGTRIQAVLGLVVLLVLGLTTEAEAQTPGAETRPGAWATETITQYGTTRTIRLAINKSRVLELPRPVRVVSIGNPDVADVVVMRARQIYVLGKSLGTTNVVLWDDTDRVQAVLNLEITHDLETLKATLHEMLPGEPIEVRSARDRLILSGPVTSTARMDSALRLANGFAGAGGNPVLNMMEVGGSHQVMLDVKVAEVSRTLIKRLGINFNAFDSGSPWKIGAVQGGASFPDAIFNNGGRIPVFGDGTPVGPVITEFAPTTATIGDTGLFASYLSGDFLFNMVIDAAEREGVAKILAEPNLTTLSGQEAHFLAGGEFPIPVPQDLGRVTIEYKEFGVGLRFLPLVLDSGHINLKVDVSVSDVTQASTIVIGAGEQAPQQFLVPALVKRAASSTVELGHGQTIAIAGMINENLRDNINKFPGLGDLPILGMLFRSQDFAKDQTELVIFVTPRLARPITPQQARLPTGSFVAPSNLEFYLLGRLPRRRAPDREQASADGDVLANRRDGGTAGQFGHGM
jgi:pilus assembly protein CpaC